MPVHMTAAAVKRLQGGTNVPAKPRKRSPCHVGTPTGQTGPLCAVQSITFELPLPPTACSPNNHDVGRVAGIVAGKARAAYRSECLRLLPTTKRMFLKAVISCEWFLAPCTGRYHPRDEQNASASIKAACDAIVEAGYLFDDGAKYLHWGETTLRRAKESEGRACVVVTLRRETT